MQRIFDPKTGHFFTGMKIQIIVNTGCDNWPAFLSTIKDFQIKNWIKTFEENENYELCAIAKQILDDRQKDI